MNETRHQLATNLFSRPHRCSEATDVEALAHALQFEQRLADALQAPANLQRKRIWDLSGTLHCSIIGTCLSTGELRQLLIKLQVPGAAKATDHDLHGQAVAMASNRGGNSKQLHKALDRRHRATINQFEKARSESEVRELWSAALARGEVPGAYWAALTHPHSSHALIKDVFSDVHMLSHLVGAANRADIRRLSRLEVEKAALEEKVLRQQDRLREVFLERAETVSNLNHMLAQRLAKAVEEHQAPDQEPQRRALEKLVADLEKRLAAETRRRVRAEDRQRDLEGMEAALRAAERTADELRRESAAAEAAIAAVAEGRADSLAIDLDGARLLYVGGKSNLLPAMRVLAERCAAQLAHHDGGVEANVGLLPGLIGRADVVLFPVDCISHDAAIAVKRACRQVGTRYMPLRSAGLTSYTAALHAIAAAKATESVTLRARR